MPVIRVKLLTMSNGTLYLFGDSTSAEKPLTADRNLLDLFNLTHLYKRHIQPQPSSSGTAGGSKHHADQVKSESSFGVYIEQLPGNNTPQPNDTLSRLAHSILPTAASSSSSPEPPPLPLGRFDESTLQRAFALQESKQALSHLDRSWLGIEEPTLASTPESASTTSTTIPPGTAAAPTPNTSTVTFASPATTTGPSLKLKIRLPMLGSISDAGNPYGSGDEAKKKKKKHKRSHDEMDIDDVDGSQEKKKHKTDHDHDVDE
ncbi:hypothetical protein SmJEL517_g01678 [Synchytrium microbalum]|uniref:Uncharacterized protein n=1 Tax=Synchytrium microbalum TaxID=1806994 RepID=A0A507C8N4_9FUNG|nr:uncharacterized protein SmJEL517_g01678 [Synchytrium microbalum]TPX35881.1 hypothetical protein SmJEL517_g01678 [Synchytrium microbalum]